MKKSELAIFYFRTFQKYAINNEIYMFRIAQILIAL
jgi:hypothetical protein